jgi:hypothetical protein
MMDANVTEPNAISSLADELSHSGRYFRLDASFWPDGSIPGLEIANEASLRPPGAYVVLPPTGEPGQYPERPHLVHLPEKGGLPRDFEILSGIWIVSEALKRVFERVDPEAFSFVECDFTLSDGSQGPRHHFCSVIRAIDALDEAASRVRIKTDHNFITGEDEPFYSIVDGASLVFKGDIVGNAHVFRQPRCALDAICDRVMFDALAEAQLDGIELRDCFTL